MPEPILLFDYINKAAGFVGGDKPQRRKTLVTQPVNAPVASQATPADKPPSR